MLRINHARQAEKLATISWEHPTDKTSIFLIDDIEIRQMFGRVIGKIASSHWWDIKKVEDEFSRTIGAPSWCPRDWTIDPLKVACILRVADASHIDSRRAPTFLRILRKLNPVSDTHWGFQEKLQKPYIIEDSLNYSSGYAFSPDESSQWWLCYETLNLIDKELRQVDTLLADKGMQRFNARRVFGIESPDRLTSLIHVEGWFPFDAFVHIGDIPQIIRCLGGEELYGKNPDVAIRELIQNSSDAIRARRIIEERDDDWGEVAVSHGSDDIGEWIEVSDNGLGMSINVIKSYLLDFGNSYWNSSLFQEEYPGAVTRGINQTGKYGIGFFSVFMLGNKVQVITRQSTAGLNETIVLEFNEGIKTRPIIREAKLSECLRDGGTKIKVWLSGDRKIKEIFLNRYDLELSFEEFCLAISPSLDCNIVIVENDNKIKYEADYWSKCSNQEFIELIIKFNKIGCYPEGKINYDYLKKHMENIELLIDEKGEVFGRACLIPSTLFSENTDINLDGLLTIGGLASSKTGCILGILKADTINAAREIGQVKASREIIAKWVTSQANKISNIYDKSILLRCSGIVRLLGGNPCNLPIIKTFDKYFSMDEFIEFLSDKNSIIILDDFFETYRLKDIKNFTPESNVFITQYSGVPSLIYSSTPRYSQLFDNNHKDWHYTQTNLGFIIECIHKAWEIDLEKLIKIKSSDSVYIGKSDDDMIFENAFIYSRID